MRDSSMTVVRCAVGMTDGFKVEVGPRIRPEPFLVCYGDGQTDRCGEARIFVDDDVCESQGAGGRKTPRGGGM